MRTLVGRLLQLIAMILLPYGLFIGLFRDNVRLEVNLLFLGGAFFLVGWMMARKPGD